jgi:hypothetical protein
MNPKLYNVKVVLRLRTGLPQKSRGDTARAIMRPINAHIQSGRPTTRTPITRDIPPRISADPVALWGRRVL